MEDLRQLLDALRIERAVLVGWSLGGNEITEFAARWPDRVRALVHLDTFNLADPDLARANANFAYAFFPAPDDLASVEAFSEWQERTWWLDTDWTPAMGATAADLVVTNPDGSVDGHLRQRDGRALCPPRIVILHAGRPFAHRRSRSLPNRIPRRIGRRAAPMNSDERSSSGRGLTGRRT